MKTAEEWMSQMSGLDKPALLTVNRMAIREIQLDAYKAGMTKSAEIAKPEKCWPECNAEFCRARDFVEKEITEARDNITIL